MGCRCCETCFCEYYTSQEQVCQCFLVFLRIFLFL
nr:MAG TPA: Melon necrotic spot virus P7B protein [Caudoviricetes sp.]